MSVRERDIVFEDGELWILRVAKGYEVLKRGITHSTRVAFIGDGLPGGSLERAKSEIAKRQGAGR